MNATKPQEHQLLLNLAELTEEPLDWLWPGRVPLGKPVLFDGDPGRGKSLVTLDMAARLTRGRALPDGTFLGKPMSVVLVGSEDGLRDTVLPRLRAAGADLVRVHCFAGKPRDGLWSGWPVLPDDCPELTRAVRQMQARLVIIDPLTAYLGGRASGTSEGSVRRALAPLAVLARDTHAAMIWVRHLSKRGSGQSALYRGSGPIAIAAAARSAFLIGIAPDDPSLRVLACTKNNLAAPPPALGFRIEADGSGQPVVRWTGRLAISADELLSAPGGQGEALKRAKAFLEELLRDGPRPADDVGRRAEQAGINAMTLRRAKQALQLRSTQSHFGGKRQWFWSLATGSPLPSPAIHAQWLREAAERGARFIQRLCELPLPPEEHTDEQPADQSRDGA